MRDILRLLLGDDGSDEGAGWDQPSRRPSVAASREWCGSGPGDDAIRQAAEQLRGRGRTGRRGVVIRGGRRAGPFGI